ncbi:hypothetical protein BJAS_P1613 [Bathymodiolus japonicus methanotrophic gill symbiont]|uniref:OmpA family protein n=1 Tax=Bathymodiolus japonicus methanotrophic gill symbiont TaxID=113269 RepID=UPI001B3F9051|nr:OmpA family protein [Bathymodiolus japonicus methanotrophic gill symbiont]GFO71844.1 hypothetical protein BJAS_P1613 [Bathymodiolus japonicus methanotrophic gill symbiont]
MDIKVIIWVAFVILLLIMTVQCEKSHPVQEAGIPSEQVVVVTEEIVANETAISLTTTVDDFIVLNGALLFAHDEAELSDDSRAILDERIAKYRGKVKNTLDIEVIGYTDNSGDASYNQSLSLRRAQAVADYIEQQTDIPHNEIKVIGMGATESKSDATTEESQAIERRVEIHFMGVILQ